MPNRFCLLILALCGASLAFPAEERGNVAAFMESEVIFSLEHWHNHASCIIELPNGDLLVCWFHGSGERTADDVKVEGARKKKDGSWSPRFTMADTPGYPDTNPCMFIDPRGKLWLLWPTILANTWESALMKYRISSDYLGDGPPKWETSEVLHVTPDDRFAKMVHDYLDQVQSASQLDVPEQFRPRLKEYIARLGKSADDKLARRLGWMTRAHPFVVDNTRLIVPLYSDLFSFSLMAISDDWGATWHTSTPLIGAGNIQPSIIRRDDGSLYTLMRDNGPPPKRLHQSESRDRGEVWSKVTDTDLPNPGSGAEIIRLKNGHCVLISNDAENHRSSLAVQLSEDEGRTWKWKRHLESDPPGPQAGSYHYPSIFEAKDGTLHASYSFHLKRPELALETDGQPAAKSIKHAHFNEAWVMQGDTR